MARADFVPRANTGFQVKKPDMAAGAIRKEMCPKGALRPAIAELAQLQGAYIIVSAQGSVADKPLQERREAMRAQLTSLASPTDLYVDFTIVIASLLGSMSTRAWPHGSAQSPQSAQWLDLHLSLEQQQDNDSIPR